jgi:hypothetical protein
MSKQRELPHNEHPAPETTVTPEAPARPLEGPPASAPARRTILPTQPGLRALNAVAKTLTPLSDSDRQWVIDSLPGLFPKVTT